MRSFVALLLASRVFAIGKVVRVKAETHVDDVFRRIQAAPKKTAFS